MKCNIVKKKHHVNLCPEMYGKPTQPPSVVIHILFNLINSLFYWISALNGDKYCQESS